MTRSHAPRQVSADRADLARAMASGAPEPEPRAALEPLVYASSSDPRLGAAAADAAAPAAAVMEEDKALEESKVLAEHWALKERKALKGHKALEEREALRAELAASKVRATPRATLLCPRPPACPPAV